MVSNGYTSKCSGHTGLTCHFNFLTFEHSGTLALRTELRSARMSKKIKNGGLDQYGAERFGIDSFLSQSEKV